MRTGIRDSINTIAVQSLQAVGVTEAFAFATENLNLSLTADDMNLSALGLGGLTYGLSTVEMAAAYASFANGGVYNSPRMYVRVTDANGNTVLENEGESHVAMKESTAYLMTDMLQNAVNSGTGSSAKFAGMSIAGKTGTAEKLAETGGYAAGKYIASFVGFVPADKPQYAMLIMLDTPQGAFYGSQVSAPVFRDTLQQILVAKGIQPSSSEGLPSFEQHVRNNPAVNSTVPPPAKMPQMEILADGKIKLPDFSGLDMRQTAELIQQGRLVLVPHGSGRARKQSQPPGTVVAEGTKLEIWFE